MTRTSKSAASGQAQLSRRDLAVRRRDPGSQGGVEGADDACHSLVREFEHLGRLFEKCEKYNFTKK